MEPLKLKQRQPAEMEIECWDDDADFEGVDDLHLRNISTTTTTTVGSDRRDLTSSRMSTRSDRDSAGGGDEDWQVLLPTDDEKLAADAISAVKTAGIPIPANVPASALLGGTIKRLGGRRIKKALMDDWADEIEIPKAQDGGLKLKKMDDKDGSETLRMFSAEFPPSPKTSNPSQSKMTFMERMTSATKPKAVISPLDKYRDDDNDDFFGDVSTIKVPKNRTLETPIQFRRPAMAIEDVEKFEEDLEIPDDGKPLKLSARKDAPRTPLHEDLDMEWAEGSLGTRFGGTRRDARSNPSSSISAFSPSASSCLTGESEDEGLEGLVLPDGPLKFGEALQKRLENMSPDPVKQDPEPRNERPKKPPAKEDDFSGLEIGDGKVFDSEKLTLNPNVKLTATKKTSPAKRPATTLTFTNKLEPNLSKIPRPQPHPQERNRSVLEPVSESGGPVPHYRRPGSRVGGHSAQSSLSAIPTPSTPSSHAIAPSTPSRRGLNTKSSRDMLKSEQTTTAAQFLKAKRSAPVMRTQPSPGRSQPSYQRAPSRGGDLGGRQGLPSRPKTPTERSGAESSLANSRKAPVPFLPAGTSSSQSHHISTKSSRPAMRPHSSDSNESGMVNRPVSRLSNPHHRPVTPNGRRDHAPEALTREAASKRTLTKPTRRRNFGTGNELDAFDDLPTSASTESKFIKQPVGRGAPKAVQMRSKLGLQSHNLPTASVNEIPPQTPTPLSPQKHDQTPRFARDTNASRLAREQRMGSVTATLHANPTLPTVRETNGPLSSISTNRKTTIQQERGKFYEKSASKRRKGPPQKPQLIKSFGANADSPKTEKGMTWNPTTFRWEGNENEPSPFDVHIPPPAAHSSPKSPTTGKAVPALISNITATKGVQIEGGMVFDPHRMCWLKMAPQPNLRRRGPTSNPMSPSNIDDDDDPFAGFDDLDDGKKPGESTDTNSLATTTAAKSTSLVEDEWLVGEEFDVGPEFIKRQRAEEERWRAKVEGWVGEGVVRDEGVGREGWKWSIRGKIPDLL